MTAVGIVIEGRLYNQEFGNCSAVAGLVWSEQFGDMILGAGGVKESFQDGSMDGLICMQKTFTYFTTT